MKISHLAVPVLTVALIGGAVGQEDTGHEATCAELSRVLARADVHNKRVLAVLVEDGKDQVAAWKSDTSLSRTMLYEFEVMQLSGSQADAWAKRWKFPAAVQEKPAIVVLDSQATVLARLPAADVATDAEAFLTKLKPHFCEPVDAEKKLAAALVAAKKSGRSVFIRFDAPW